MIFSKTLKCIRKQLNLTQEQFARELNVSFSTINRWENGRTTPSTLAKKQILDYCKSKCVNNSVIEELENY